MMRSLLILILIIAVYYTLKKILTAALTSSGEHDKREKVKGQDMVLDPECQTYVVRNRAVTRRIQGTPTHFCSEACAEKYEEKHRK